MSRGRSPADTPRAAALRVVGTNIDIGAYELQTTSTPVVAQVYKQRNCDPGGTIQSFVFDTGTNNYGFTITIQVPANGASYTATATTSQYWGPNGDIVIPIGPQS